MSCQNDRPTRILVADWVPSLNKGEMAILMGMLRTFEVLGKVEVSAFSFYPQFDRERYPKNVRIIDATSDLYLGTSLTDKSNLVVILASLFAMLQHIFFGMMYAVIGDKALRIMNRMIWREYCRSDVIIICHDQVSCIYGPRLLRFSPMYITTLAKTLGKPVVIYANGFARFRRAITRIGLWNILARYVLNNADLITVREEESYRNLKDISVNNARIYLTADPAFLLSPVSYNKVKDILLDENINKSDALLIGMTQTREILLSIRQEEDPKEIYKKAIEHMARLVDHLIDNLNATVVFLPHCIEPYRQGNGDDRDVAKEVYNLTTNKHKVVVITKEYSAEELKGLIGVFDLFIGGRVHSVISALSMGVPSITLTRSRDERVCGIIGKTLKQEEWICNIEGLNSEILLSKIMALLSLREEIRKNLALHTSITKEKALLNGKLLKALLDAR